MRFAVTVLLIFALTSIGVVVTNSYRKSTPVTRNVALYVTGAAIAVMGFGVYLWGSGAI